MRTTLDIDDPLLRQLRVLQKREKLTLGELVSRLLAQALAEQPRRPAAPFTWIARPMKARVDLGDKDALYAILDHGADEAAER